MLDGRRAQDEKTTRPTSSDGGGLKRLAARIGLGRRLVALGVNANMVTAFGVLVSAVTAVLLGMGAFKVAVVLFVLGGLMDALDGAVAKAAETASPQGAFVDSVCDRLTDGLLLAGIAWYLSTRSDPRLALLPVAVLIVSSVVSYERAKAESLGFSAKGGLMERAERLILLGVGILLPFLLVPVLWTLLALTSATACGRFVRVWRQAGGETTPSVFERRAAAAVMWRRGRVDSRWRSWREAGALASRSGGRFAWQGRRRTVPRAARLREERREASASRRMRAGGGTARSVSALRRRLDESR